MPATTIPFGDLKAATRRSALPAADVNTTGYFTQRFVGRGADYVNEEKSPGLAARLLLLEPRLPKDARDAECYQSARIQDCNWGDLVSCQHRIRTGQYSYEKRGNDVTSFRQ